MSTLVKDPPPLELERRRALGQDGRDEVSEGVYVMKPWPVEGHSDIATQLSDLLGPPARKPGLWRRIGGFNLREPDDVRVPDGAARRPGPGRRAAPRAHQPHLVPTAAPVIEIISPGDDTPKKIPFDAKHGVDEILILDPDRRAVEWLALAPDGTYEPVEHNRLIDLSVAEVAAAIDWPQ